MAHRLEIAPLVVATVAQGYHMIDICCNLTANHTNRMRRQVRGADAPPLGIVAPRGRAGPAVWLPRLVFGTVPVASHGPAGAATISARPGRFMWHRQIAAEPVNHHSPALQQQHHNHGRLSTGHHLPGG